MNSIKLRDVTRLLVIAIVFAAQPTVANAQEEFQDDFFAFFISSSDPDPSLGPHTDFLSITNDKAVTSLTLSIENNGDGFGAGSGFTFDFPDAIIEINGLLLTADFSVSELPIGTYEVGQVFVPDPANEGFGLIASGQFSDGTNFSSSVSVVPEPTSCVLLSLVAATLGCRRRRTSSTHGL